MFIALLLPVFIALFPSLRDHSFTTAMYYKLYKEVRHDVPHEADQEMLKELFGELKDQAKNNAKKQAELYEQFWIVDQNYHSTYDDYARVITSLDSLIRETEVLILIARDSLKGTITQEQWEESYTDIDNYLQRSLRKLNRKIEQADPYQE